MPGFNRPTSFNKPTSLNAIGTTQTGFNSLATPAGPPPPTPIFLDGIPTSAVFALRRTKNAYTGPLIQVRRSNDNALADIGYDSNGNLDQTALLAHTGANSGFVATWYDQSGNGYNATQGTAANQPSIVNAGVIRVQNSLPTLNFNGSTHRMLLTGTALGMLRNVAGSSAFLVGQSANTAANQGFFNVHAGATSTNGRPGLPKNTSNRIQAVAKALDTDSGMFASNFADPATLITYVIVADYLAPNCTLYRTNTSLGNSATGSTAGNTDNTDSLAIFIGCRGNGVTQQVFLNGNISELILMPYAVDNTTRATIATNQATFYSTT